MKKIFIPLVIALTLLTNISMAGIDAPDILSNPKLQSEASEVFNIAHKIFGNAWILQLMIITTPHNIHQASYHPFQKY